MIDWIYYLLIKYQFGIFGYLVISTFTWILIAILCIIAFPIYMKVKGFPARFPWMFVFYVPYRLRIDSAIAADWFIKKNYTAISIIALLILYIDYKRALENSNAVEFARGGSVVVAAGLFLLIIDLYEGPIHRWQWAKIDNKLTEALKDISSAKSERSHRRATWYIVVISAIGTLVWAYGDQALACYESSFSLAGKDKSGVICFSPSRIMEIREEETATNINKAAETAKTAMTASYQSAQSAAAMAGNSARLAQVAMKVAQQSANFFKNKTKIINKRKIYKTKLVRHAKIKKRNFYR